MTSQSKSLKNWTPKDGSVLAAIVQTKEVGCIKEMESAGALSAQLILIAKQYLGTENPDPDVLKECNRMIKNQFGLLGVHEIRIAFQKWASGEYGEKKESYGKFTVRHIGSVLSAYVEETRKQALRDFYNQVEQSRASEEESKKQEMREQYDRDFPKWIKEAKGKEWSEISSHWYKSAIRLGLMEEPNTQTKKAYFLEARKIYQDQENGKEHESAFKAMAGRQFREQTEKSAIASIAKRMIVQDRLL